MKVLTFFDNDFDYKEFMKTSLSKNSKTIVSEESLKTPNNTAMEYLRKRGLLKII